MNTTTVCRHGDHPACCLECLNGMPDERPNAPAARPRPSSNPFFAQWSGHCQGCNLAIHAGQAVVRMTDETYQHAGCGALS